MQPVQHNVQALTVSVPRLFSTDRDGIPGLPVAALICGWSAPPLLWLLLVLGARVPC